MSLGAQTRSSARDFAAVGNKEQIKGEGSYKFMLWADDDDPDTFRIHIWDDNGTVYDNESQGEGSIKVHSR